MMKKSYDLLAGTEAAEVPESALATEFRGKACPASVAAISANPTTLYVPLQRRSGRGGRAHAPRVSKKAAMRVRASLPLPKESGVTLLIVAVAMFALLAMAMLALDVVNLYVSSDQAQRSADAAALAGAEAFVTSSTTSNSAVPLNTICNGSSGDADLRAQMVAAQNPIAGSPPSTVTTSCPTSPDHNPRIQVTVSQSGIANFFARIWGSSQSSVSATAIAEAYNPSFDPANPSSTPISIHGVKPWGVANCNTCPGGPVFFTSNYAIASVGGIPGTFIGQSYTLTLMDSSTSPSAQPPNTAQFYALDSPAPLSCPDKSVAVNCSNIGTGPPGIYYHDNIACEGSLNYTNGQQIGPGQPVQVDTRSIGTIHARTVQGTTCLIHASNVGPGQGQDSFSAGPPLTVTGGFNNPNPSLKLVAGIHRSDSLVTVPVFNCPPAGPCNGTVQLPIVGFLQLGVEDVSGSGDLHAVIVNAAGVDPANTGSPIIGAGTSPIPVRLIQ